MAKALRCTGYALAGAVLVPVTLAAFGAVLFGFFYLGTALGALLGVSDHNYPVVGFLLAVASLGAAMGAAICKERSR